MRNFIAPDTKDRIQVGRSSTKAAPPPTNLPPLSELDPSVLASLPPEILAEIREVYGELAAQPVVSSKPAKNYLSPVAVMKGAHKTKTSEVSNRVDRREDGIRRVLPLEPLTERGESSRPPSVRPEIVALPPASQVMKWWEIVYKTERCCLNSPMDWYYYIDRVMISRWDLKFQ